MGIAARCPKFAVLQGPSAPWVQQVRGSAQFQCSLAAVRFHKARVDMCFSSSPGDGYAPQVSAPGRRPIVKSTYNTHLQLTLQREAPADADGMSEPAQLLALFSYSVARKEVMDSGSQSMNNCRSFKVLVVI